MGYKHVPLLEMPALDDKNYIRKEDGGYAVTVKGSPLHKNLTVLSNCVGLACGTYNKRWQEIMGKNPGIHTLLLNCNAENFPERAKKFGLELEDKPSLGAIICWRKGNIGDGTDGAGHVATVEKIIDENNITLAESAYGGTAFYVKTRNNNNGNWGMNPPYYFRYFIPLPKRSRITPVEENKYANQVLVSTDALRVRTGPSLDSDVVGQCQNGAFYNVTEVIEGSQWTSQGITDNKWYHIEDCYVAAIPGTSYRPKDSWIDPIPVEKNSLKNQIFIKVSDLRIRKGPSTATEQLGFCKSNSYYNIYESKICKDYVWFRIGSDAWCAGVYNAVDLYLIENN